jgi:serine/threonine-protein phosphatase 2A regulatory subunit B
MTEFQSHEPEFDYLKSLEIEEKINKVRWVRSSNNTRMLLSTNDKTVKLWKVGGGGHTPKMFATASLQCFYIRSWCTTQVYEKKVTNLTNFNLEGRSAPAPGGAKTNAISKPSQLRMPKVCARVHAAMQQCHGQQRLLQAVAPTLPLCSNCRSPARRCC